MALADQTYFNGCVTEAVGKHRPTALVKGVGCGRHRRKQGNDTWEEEEEFCGSCPPESGYKHVGDPLRATR